MAAKKQSFEQAMDALEQIVNRMTDGEPNLDEALKLYQKGLELAVFCGEKLDAAEAKVLALKAGYNEKGGKTVVEDSFDDFDE